MSAWSFASAVYGSAWTTPELWNLFADEPRTRRWLEILAVLAETQAEFGLIPTEAAGEIAVACRALPLDGAFFDEWREGYRTTNHSTAGLIAAVKRRLADASGEWFYYGATVQDLTDTWLALALGDARALIDADLARAIEAARTLAENHRTTVMAGRTHGQQGLPITFGFKAASWLDELRRHRERLAAVGARLRCGQLGGGVGSLSSLGPQAVKVQECFFARLGLRAPAISWTASRDVLAEWGYVLALATAGAERIGQEVFNLQRDEISELRESASGAVIGSITMPHKRNPELSEQIGTLARVVRANAAALAEALPHSHERDGRSWKLEWHALPELTMAAGKAMSLLAALLEGLEVRPDRMRANLDMDGGFFASEALMLALARRTGKQTAHQIVHRLARAARDAGLSLHASALASEEIVGLLDRGKIEALFTLESSTGACAALVDRVLGGDR
ncbi:MAG: adenylosuccinate lyase family protein [Betaproteobacteria bacterium]|nr:adenylosuccinate lyase family protein [Betaproteobacteria bacterium]